MQIPEPIETYGYFWLADKPHNRLSGVLSVSENGRASLEIFGSFSSPRSRPMRQRTTQEINILGVTDKAGAVTLVDCMVIQQNDVVNIDLLSKTSLHVDYVFWGEHFDTEEICFSSMRFSVEGLDEWFAFYHHPFSSDWDQAGTMSFAYTPPEPITFQISDDLTMGFNMGAETKSSRFHESVTTKMSITIESRRLRPFSEFMQILLKVKNFLCLAFDRTVSFTFITGYRHEPNAPDSPHKSVVVYGRFDPYDLPKEDISLGHSLILFAEVVQNIQECLTSWLEHYEEYEPTFNLYFTVAANRYMHLEGRFLFLVHGIESLHRRGSSKTRMPSEEFRSLLSSILQSIPNKWKTFMEETLRYGNELPLRKRIEEMIAPFDDLFGTKSERKRLVNQVTDTRNYFTHYDEGIKNKAVTEPHALLRIHQRLEGLVQLHMLRLLGFGHDHIMNMATRYPPLREKLGIP